MGTIERLFCSDDENFNVHMPKGMAVAPPVSGGDHQIAAMDGTNKRWLYTGDQRLHRELWNKCRITCQQSRVIDNCNPYQLGGSPGGKCARDHPTERIGEW